MWRKTHTHTHKTIGINGIENNNLKKKLKKNILNMKNKKRRKIVFLLEGWRKWEVSN